MAKEIEIKSEEESKNELEPVAKVVEEENCYRQEEAEEEEVSHEGGGRDDPGSTSMHGQKQSLSDKEETGDPHVTKKMVNYFANFVV